VILVVTETATEIGSGIGIGKGNVTTIVAAMVMSLRAPVDATTSIIGTVQTRTALEATIVGTVNSRAIRSSLLENHLSM